MIKKKISKIDNSNSIFERPMDYPPDSSPARITEEIRNALKPLPEELEYVCKDEELKLLCRHFHVKVDMTKFNCLDHFYRIYKRRGSLKERSKSSTLRLLMKAFKHYKNDKRHVYSQQEIDDEILDEWKFRKSQQVRFLKEKHNKSFVENDRPVSNENNATDNSVIESYSIQNSAPILIPEAPDYVLGFMDALKSVGMRQPFSISQETDDSQPASNVDNSLRALEAEIFDNIDSADSCLQLGTESVADSIASACPHFPSQNLENYNSFNEGNPKTSTQGF